MLMAKIEVDLMELNKLQYLVIVGNYSRYVELFKLDSTIKLSCD